MVVENELCTSKTTNIHCATNEDAVAAKGTWLFPAILVTEHLFVYSSEKISSPALETQISLSYSLYPQPWVKA